MVCINFFVEARINNFGVNFLSSEEDLDDTEGVLQFILLRVYYTSSAFNLSPFDPWDLDKELWLEIVWQLLGDQLSESRAAQ